uniref:ATP synthase subunit a n=1 Tax=Virgulibracon endoxylaphagus TaxID=2933211 RepID=A0A8T9JE83_9HYME|nr:ATP synthase F0 subunit 6 [Virgulibracon endoxylaphagus]UOK09628.1 ATP synthase F0 subunit 6 [Virgulibracon endoxylaphagus]
MLMNLFSIFDPQVIFFYQINWFSTLIILFIIPQIYWILSSRIIYLINKFYSMLWFEFKIILKNNFNNYNLIYLITLFMYIMMNNFMGLFPYIFTSSSHLIFSMTFSLSLWLSLMMFSLSKNMIFMLAHLVPQGTPFMLMFFMVLIEFLSNLIRPLTLCIRLTANMIAGHLLLVLLSSFIPVMFSFYQFILIFQLILLILEVGVSLIQAYVFVILVTLYLKETN